MWIANLINLFFLSVLIIFQSSFQLSFDELCIEPAVLLRPIDTSLAFGLLIGFQKLEFFPGTFTVQYIR